jgi:hypothetical protein
MSEIQEIYLRFLGNFPEFLHPFISLALAVLVAYAVFQTLRRNFLYIIVLIVLLPAAVPILKSAGQGIVDLVKFLLGMS